MREEQAVSGLAERRTRSLVEVVRDEDGLRLVPAREYDALPEQPHPVDHLGEVGARLGHSHALFVGRSHATTVHARSILKCVALYNSEVRNCAALVAQTPFPAHLPLRKLERA